MTTIEANGLTKRYGRRVGLDRLRLRAAAGDIVGLLGPNGAGKTTVIRVLSTVLPPTSGSFTVAGIPHTSPASIRRRIGVLPEGGGYRARETGLETLTVQARLFGLNRHDAVQGARRRLAQVGLADRADSPTATYSRGMRQRLGIARALVNDPAVVFLDEPTLGLDPAGRRQMAAVIAGVAAEQGTTVLLSTHSLPDVENLCGQVVILSAGRLLAAGTVAEVIATAAAARTARIRVLPEQREAAETALRRVFPEGAVGVDAEQPSTVLLSLPDGTGRLGVALRALLDAGLDVVGLDVDAPRLSDAFLRITGADTP